LNYWFVRAWGERAKAHFRQRYLQVRQQCREQVLDALEPRILPAHTV